MPVGFQDYWVAGERFLFKRDPINGIAQPFRDLGIVQEVTPAIASEVAELEDPDGGIPALVDSSVIDQTERYDVRISNLALENLALAFLANPAAEFTQAADFRIQPVTAHPFRLLKIRDTDPDKTPIYRISLAHGAIVGTSNPPYTTRDLVGTGTAINASTKVIKISGNHQSDTGLGAGKRIIVGPQGLSNATNAITYTVVSAVDNGANTDITVAETPPGGNESSVTGGKVYYATTANDYVFDLFWEISNVDFPRGVLAVSGVATHFEVPKTVHVFYSKAPVSGRRIINPLSVQGQVQGTGLLFLSRDQFGAESVREARVSIANGGMAFPADQHASMTLSVTVLADTFAAVPAGRLLQYLGDVPTPL